MGLSSRHPKVSLPGRDLPFSGTFESASSDGERNRSPSIAPKGDPSVKFGKAIGSEEGILSLWSRDEKPKARVSFRRIEFRSCHVKQGLFDN